MKISALIFDLDGTAIPNSPDGYPSPAVLEAVRSVQNKILVACATGREIIIAKDIIRAFQLTSPCIIAGGSQVIDPLTFQPVWQRVLSVDQIKRICEVCKEVPQNLAAYADNGPGKPPAQYDYFFEKPIIYMENIPLEEAPQILVRLKTIEGIAVGAVPAWTPGNVDIHITNIEATKKHALQEWAKIEGVDLAEIMVVGDGGNDIPLFELAGFSVAMGNARDEVKAHADWVAPSVDEDGLAEAISRYILET